MANVLLVEDDDQLRTMLRELLTGSGYEVWEAANGKQGCDLYREQRFDLVVTDLVMPETDGVGVIMELRRIDQNVRIIAISGGGQIKADPYLKIARKLGVLATLSKPFGNKEFLDAVSLAIGAQAQNDPLVDSDRS